jgi:hypothetical protein
MARHQKLFQIFKAGTFTDTSGRQHSFDQQDVHSMATVYDPERRKAPLVIGHPSDDRPSFGDVCVLVEKNGQLYAQAAVEDTLIDLVRRKLYSNFSASFYPPHDTNNPRPGSLYLKHVGFLGAVPPAVKGMASLAFGECQPGIMSFSEGFAVTDYFDFALPGSPSRAPHSEMEEANRLAYQFLISRNH